MLGAMNPEKFGGLSGLTSLGALNSAASGLSPADLTAVSGILADTPAAPVGSLIEQLIAMVSIFAKMAPLMGDIPGAFSLAALNRLGLPLPVDLPLPLPVKG
ncbi:hypothetical protein M501DRAFT_1013700 [Patellaria atrata CBS 101060]|uniref:Uncharacterized protein n=1 Tax=Patellaria atrata CBS 101060 TaxID=1346257 RepID=A0A9P4VW49_9PEZI|nr:hypothetical protein M501DRAFT_1013700 [Patellaria atrata CBS 101060]